jgi:hypothetical protein
LIRKNAELIWFVGCELDKCDRSFILADRSSETKKSDRSFILGDRSSETRKGDLFVWVVDRGRFTFS